MGDHIYYETASGRVAKRDFKSPADLRRAIAEETDPDDAAEMQRRLDRRLEEVGAVGRATVRGIGWFQRRLNQLVSIPDSIVESAAGVEEGELARQRERITRERALVEATLQTQKNLRARFEAQEAADRAREAAAERAAAAARKQKIAAARSKRKRGNSENQG